jgi:hypothetical protein
MPRARSRSVGELIHKCIVKHMAIARNASQVLEDDIARNPERPRLEIQRFSVFLPKHQNDILHHFGGHLTRGNQRPHKGPDGAFAFGVEPQKPGVAFGL